MTITPLRNCMLHVESAHGVPVVTITGTPRSMGTSLGQRLQPRLAVLIQDVLQALCTVCDDASLIDDDGGFDQSLAEEWLRAQLGETAEHLRGADPSLWMEMQSMAEVCGIDVIFLLAIHAYNDLLDHFSRERAFFESDCLSLRPCHNDMGVPLLAMDWSIPPYLLPHLMLIRRIPAHGPATLSLSLAGLHTVAGISASGVAVASNDLRDAINEEGGLPSPSMIQICLGASTYDDALAKLQRLHFRGGRCVHLLGPQGHRCSIEITGSMRFRLPNPFPDSPRVHTNHRLHDGAPGDGSGAVCWSQQRLKHLARNVARATADTPLEQIDRWFDTDSAQDQPRHRTASRDRPVSAAIVILDPVNQRIWCHGGGAPGVLKAVGI